MNNAAGLTPLLIDAKKEYVGQLTDVLTPYVINTLQGIYTTAAAQRTGATTAAFQRALRDIPTWNSTIITNHARDIENRFPFLGDLIAACFVAYVKILSSVKLHQQKPNIRLKLPSNDTFVHKVYVHTAREFYSNPALLRGDRSTKVAVVRAAVEASIRDMLPLEDILKAYLGNTVDGTDGTVNPGELADDDVVADAEEDDKEEYNDMYDEAPPQQPQQPQQPFPVAPQYQQQPQQPFASTPPAFPSQPSQPAPQAEDDAAKRIQIGQTPTMTPALPTFPSVTAPGTATTPPLPTAAPASPAAPPPQAPQQDLFSDAEDDF